ncbi:MAG: restriction endonuclease [Acidobacteriia bacterium]|nr:restriction endonuclease [Terriglobia bacterium]
MLDEISRLDPFKFQELCTVLLQKQFPSLRSVDGSGGDEGVDAWIPDTQTYFQFHAPKVRVQRAKFSRYLQQAAKHSPAKWVFITNRDFTRTQWRWIDELRHSVAFAVEVWGATELAGRLQVRPDLRDHYLSLPVAAHTIQVGDQRAHQISNIAAHNVNVTVRGRSARTRVVVSGVVANEPTKLGYLKYLARRYNEFKEWDVGKAQMRYPLIYTAYRREIKYSLSETPFERFTDACQFFQRRIENTKLGRIKGAQGERLFDTFEEFAAR